MTVSEMAVCWRRWQASEVGVGLLVAQMMLLTRTTSVVRMQLRMLSAG